MASDASGEGAFPYWTGWHAVGCAVLFFGLLGSIAVAFLPAGYERVQTGQMPTGVAMMVLGVFGIPTLGMAFVSLYAGVRNQFRPPLLRVTATGLVLPAEARGEHPLDEHGEPTSNEPLHPEVIPFATVRGVTRSGPRNNQVMDIVHDGCAEPLHLHQYMMRRADFDALVEVLRVRCGSSV